MQEIYQRAAKIYKELVDNPPSDPDLCSCANDVTANGILTEVVNIAKQLKYRARDARCNRASSNSYQKYNDYDNGCSDKYERYNLQAPGPIQGLNAKPAQILAHSIGKRETKADISRLREEYLENSNEVRDGQHTNESEIKFL